jgi:hypothetical protein
MSAARGELLVFVGPSLPRAEAQRLAPAAQLRPPIAVGELLAIARARRRPGCVAIIDGYFERMAAVWHKEILVAMDRGVAVWGAASMGALRAAELQRWGMIGVGSIYRQFASGQLDADDEVAVAHLSAEQDFRPISDALVNLRAGLRAAAKAGVVSERAAATLLGLARRRPYRERSWRQLYEDGTAAGVRQLTRAGWRRPSPVRVPQTWALRQLIRLIEA